MKPYGETIQNAGTQRYGRTKKTQEGKGTKTNAPILYIKTGREKEKDGGKKEKDGGRKKNFSFKMFCTNILHR